MLIGGQQLSIRGLPQPALLFLQLCPEEGRSVQIPAVLWLEPALPSATVALCISDTRGLEAEEHAVRSGPGQVVCRGAGREGHVGFWAGNDFIVFVTGIYTYKGKLMKFIFQIRY